MIVTLKRQMDDDDERDVEDNAAPSVVCPRFSGRKSEGWWLVIGDLNADTILTTKRVSVGIQSKVSLFVSCCRYFCCLSIFVRLNLNFRLLKFPVTTISCSF